MAVTIACNDDSDKIKTFSALADITGAAPLTTAKEKYNMTVVYSTDGGKTYVDWPAVAKGQSYLAKVVVRDDGDMDLKTTGCYVLDWSGSTPAPDNVDANIATFTMQKDNNLLAKITYTNYLPFVASNWTGKWGGDEVGKCCSGTDKNTLTQDPANPNKFIMDNFWGDGVDAYVIFSPSTSADTQTVTLPEQTTSEGGVAKGTGTYDVCTMTFTIATSYKIGGKTYEWQYNFHR